MDSLVQAEYGRIGYCVYLGTNIISQGVSGTIFALIFLGLNF